MPPMSRSQIQSLIRQAEDRRRRAINDYNSTVRRYNDNVKRAVDGYNRVANAHNATVRANRERLARELARLSVPRTTTVYVQYRRSVTSLRQSFARIETAAEAGGWSPGDDIYDLAAGETANSVSVLNAVTRTTSESTDPTDPRLAQLQMSEISADLDSISPDLRRRWDGALYALSPRNPDAARHFCTSSREILSLLVETMAPDDAVIAAGGTNLLTPEGKVSRRARIQYSLAQRGTNDRVLEEFVDADIENVILLFRDFNEGTHGGAGRFDLAELAAIKKRVEDAVHFLHHLTR